MKWDEGIYVVPLFSVRFFFSALLYLLLFKVHAYTCGTRTAPVTRRSKDCCVVNVPAVHTAKPSKQLAVFFFLYPPTDGEQAPHHLQELRLPINPSRKRDPS